MQSDIVSKLDLLVRQGHFDQVRAALRNMEPKRVPRGLVADLASIARRVQLYKVALRLLHPIVRPDIPRRREPSPRERLEYGATLLRAGAADLARSVLQTVDAKAHPQQLLYLAMCDTTEWDYANAKRLLMEYLSRDGISDYQRLIAKTNLASALVYLGEKNEAAEHLAELRMETSKQNLHLLYGNALELSAQMEIQRNEFAKARDYLGQSQSLIGASHSSTSLYVRKWLAVLESLEAGKVSAELLAMPKAAREKGDWESARDCDYHIGSLNEDIEILAHVAFGTPFRSYRERVESRFARVTEMSHYLWRSFEGCQEPEIVLDLETAVSKKQTEPLQPGSLVHRLLVLLCQDFYRPLNKVTAFSKLYPGDYFDPYHSPNRIHQAINRLREWLSANRYPLEVIEVRSAYRLSFEGPMAIRIARSVEPATVFETRLRSLRAHFGPAPFSSTELREALTMSFGSANELIKRALEQGRIERLGRGPKTRYRFNGELEPALESKKAS